MNSTKRKWIRIGIAAAIIAFIIVLYLLSSVLWPFLFAFFIAYIFNPWVEFFERRKFSRMISIFIVFFLIIIILVAAGLIIVPQVSREGAEAASRFPQYAEVVKTRLLPWVNDFMNAHPDLVAQAQEQFEKNVKPRIPALLSPVVNFLTSMFSSALNFILALLNLLLVPVLAFYLLKDFPQLMQKFVEIVPPRHRDVFRKRFFEVDEALGAYLRGQLTVSIALAAIYIAGLLILRVPLAVPIGLFSGLANMVPYLGFVLGIALSMLLSFVDNQEWQRLVWIAVLYTFAQVMEGVVISPIAVGERTGLHPVVIMLSLVIGGTLFGFMGMLLSVPFTAVAAVFIKAAYSSYLNSQWYLMGKGPKPTTAE
jgi:predicted PurR-regulated permease PerM